MANSITLATKFQPILDEIYKSASVTARLDAPTKPVNFAGANVVNVMKTSLIGLGDYSRATGYPVGDATITWETLTLAKERGRKFSIDAMDDEETLGQAFGTLAGEFMRTQVIPELDAYRFAKFAAWSGVGAATPATLSSTTILAAIDAASLVMDEAEVPMEGRLLYISATCNQYLQAALTRTIANRDGAIDRSIKTLETLTVIPVPQTRFYTAIDLDAGSTSNAGGFAKNSGGKDINFLMLHPSAILQATKHANLKVFSPAENQDADAWIFDYRVYHDAFVYDNKKAGVYVHNKA